MKHLSDIPGAGANGPEASTSTSVERPACGAKFTSLASARAYVDSVRRGLGGLSEGESVAAIGHLGSAYQSFPELAIEYPLEDLLRALHSAARSLDGLAVIPLILHSTTFEPAETYITQLLVRLEDPDGWEMFLSGLRLVLGYREIPGASVRVLLEVLRRKGWADKMLQLVSVVLGRVTASDRGSSVFFEDVLLSLLNLPRSRDNKAVYLAKLILAARRRLHLVARCGTGTRISALDALLGPAEHLRALVSPVRQNPSAAVGWPSARLSFNEFLLQWPCKIELPIDGDDEEFIRKAYQGILLRDPDESEMRQYLNLLKDEGLSRLWLIEDLLACNELHSLDRELQVLIADHVVTEPGRRLDDNMPTVIWPADVPT